MLANSNWGHENQSSNFCHKNGSLMNSWSAAHKLLEWFSFIYVYFILTTQAAMRVTATWRGVEKKTPFWNYQGKPNGNPRNLGQVSQRPTEIHAVAACLHACPACQWSGRFSGITGWDPSVCKSLPAARVVATRWAVWGGQQDPRSNPSMRRFPACWALVAGVWASTSSCCIHLRNVD